MDQNVDPKSNQVMSLVTLPKKFLVTNDVEDGREKKRI